MSLSTLHPNVDQYRDSFEVDTDYWFVSTSAPTTSYSGSPMDIFHPNEDQFRDLFDIDQPYWFVSTPAGPAVSRSTTDTSLTSDTASRLVSTGRSITDTSASSDAVTRTRVLPRSVSETTASTDALSRAFAVTRSTTDTSSLTDAVTTNRVYVRRPGAYTDVVKSDLPSAYWRFDESAGSTAADQVGTTPATYMGSPLNLLANPSFATDMSGWNTWSNLMSMTRSTAIAPAVSRSDLYSLFVSGSTTGVGYGELTLLTGQQYTPGTPGQVYTVSAYYYLTAITAGMNPRIYIRFNDATGALISQSNSGVLGTGLNVWARASVTATAPANTAYIQVMLSFGSSTGTVLSVSAYLDAWQLTATSAIQNYSDTQGVTLGQAGVVVADTDTSVLLDGQTGWVAVSNVPALVAAPLSWECWMAPVSTASGNAYEGVFGSGGGSTTTGMRLYIVNGHFELQVADGAATHNFSGVGTVTAGQPHHCVVTYDGTTARLYVNGSLLGTYVVGYSPAPAISGSIMGFGLTTGGGINLFKGRVDEAAVYPYALTQTQIQQHYNQGAFGNYGEDFSATSDTATRGAQLPRFTSDTSVHSDQAIRLIIQSRAVSDTSSTSDQDVVRKVQPRSVLDSTTTTDVLTRILSAHRTSVDTSSASDVATRAVWVSRPTSETTATGDVVARVLRVTRTTAEATLTTDTLTRSFNVARSSSDSTATSDATTHAVLISRSASDTTGTSDTVVRIRVAPRSVSDTTASSDAVSRGEIVARASADTSSTGDVLSRLVQRTRATSDTTSTSDAAVRLKVVSRSATDTSSSADVVSRVRTSGRPASDTTLTTDSLQRVVRRTRAISDTTTSVETVVRTLLVSRGATDTSILADAVRISIGRNPKDTSLTSDVTGTARARSTTDTSLATDRVGRYVIPWSVYPTSVSFAKFHSNVLFADATSRVGMLGYTSSVSVVRYTVSTTLEPFTSDATLDPEESAAEVTPHPTEVVNLNA